MRVLVTRPRAQAALTAARLAEAGHSVLVASVTEVEALPAIWPVGIFDAVVATSPNALRCVPPERRAGLLHLPLHAVGQATAQAARDLGFATVSASSGTATALAEDLTCCEAPHVRLLYLAGTPRKPVLEERLHSAGRTMVTVVLYRAVIAPELPAAALQALTCGKIDAVLHHSREAAARFAHLVIEAGAGGAAGTVLHACLSHDVAEGLAALGPLPHVRVAPHPTDAALLTLLDERR